MTVRLRFSEAAVNKEAGEKREWLRLRKGKGEEDRALAKEIVRILARALEIYAGKEYIHRSAF